MNRLALFLHLILLGACHLQLAPILAAQPENVPVASPYPVTSNPYPATSPLSQATTQTEQLRVAQASQAQDSTLRELGEHTADLGADWWVRLVSKPQRRNCVAVPITLNKLAIETIIYSQEVEALRVSPRILQAQVTQADAEFDPVAFVDAKWYDRDEPVGSFLATGGNPRLLEDTFTEDIGVRRRTRIGGTVEIAQQLGIQDSNSTFFVPTDQAQSRFAISLTQPLLRGAGRAYNESLIVQAQLDVRVSRNDFSTSLQNRLLRVAEEYWDLYFQRSTVLQQRRNLERARLIQKRLESRRAIDTVRSQIERAKGKVATREAALLRAEAGVRNAEATINSLVNSPSLRVNDFKELAPIDTPRTEHFSYVPHVARQIALENRPEIDRLMTQIKSASVRLDVAHNEILPDLAFVLDTYVNGLQGEYELGKALGDQFSKGAPSYTVGLKFEVPIGNRRAKAQFRQRQLEVHRLYSELNATMEELAAEVDIALREVSTTKAELESRRASLSATASEVEFLYQRWRRLPGHDQSASLFLEDLLDAEDRLVGEEQQLAASQASYAVAQVALKRALGELVVYHPNDSCLCDPIPNMGSVDSDGGGVEELPQEPSTKPTPTAIESSQATDLGQQHTSNEPTPKTSSWRNKVPFFTSPR